MRPALLPNLNDLVSFTRHFEFRAVSRWVGFCLIVGVAAGLFAAVLYAGSDLLRHWVFHLGARLSGPEPAGETSMFGHVAEGPVRSWVIVLAPAVGGLIAGWLVHAFCKEAAGGTEGYIATFHHARGRARRRVVFVKLASSTVFLGSGASTGREGPIAHIGAALGAMLGRVLKLSDKERRLLLIAGCAGGIGAIFRTPLGGALFAVEVLYRDDLEVDALVPAVLSSVVAYSVFTLLFGQGTLFGVSQTYPFDPRQLPLYLAMAVCAAVVGVLFISVFDRVARFAKNSSLWPPLIPMLGGLLVGLIALALPQSLGTGYGWLQEALLSTGAFPAGWWGAGTMLLIALVRVFTTSFSNATGAAGGVFGPAVVIGGMVGGAFGTAFHELFPTVVPEPGAFVIVGMACYVGGVTRAPISTLVMASEMTGSYELLVPTMMAEVVTFAVMGRRPHYHAQVPTRKDSPAHGGDYVLDLLQDVPIKSVLSPNQSVISFDAQTPLSQLLREVTDCSQAVFPVVSAGGKVEGLISLDALRAFFYDEDMGRLAIAADCALPFVHVTDNDSLATALQRFAASHYHQLPVVDSNDEGRILGLLSYEELLTAYSRELVRRRQGDAPPASFLPPSEALR